MRELPAGTVTFLFTDVEGSTRLLRDLGTEGYARALAEHRRVLRSAFARHGGVEVDTQGDSFFVAFLTAPGAVRAAEEAQSLLRSGHIRVRMGLHTGTPLVTPEGYVGADVHRAARIAAASHGGQVLLSGATRVLTEAEVQDLGQHRLKDLSAPERIFQLGTDEFPRLRTLHQTNLPIPTTPFVGRTRELAEVTALLAESDVRLVTLTGVGGSGKTRLALASAAASADEFPDGVWWVSLAPLGDPALVLDQASHVLGLQGDLADQLADRRLLLLFDNFEHLVAAATDLGHVLARCPNLRLIVTSRQPLQLTGEREYMVPSLAEEDAVALFSERAFTDGPPETVRAICRRLDYLPLATELAAARTRVLSPAQILERLEQRLPLLKGGPRDAPERQRTLRATIDWSYELLSSAEQRLFALLAVFVGGCTIEAAEEVAEADLDTLQSLVEKNLVRHSRERFWMLETMREYAAERLEKDEGRRVRGKHADWCIEVAAEADSRLRSPEQTKWLVLFEEEWGNMRAALAWLLATRPEEALRLLVDLDFYLGHRGNVREGDRWYSEALEKTAGSETSIRARGLREAAGFASALGDEERAVSLQVEGLALARRLGDRREEATALQGLDRFEESLAIFREIGDAHGISGTLHGLAAQHRDAGDLGAAQDLFEECLALEATSSSPFHHAAALHSLADCKLDANDVSGAARLYRESLLIGRQIGSNWITQYCLAGLAALAARTNRLELAATLWGAAERIEEAHGVPIIGRERARYEQILDSLFTDGALSTARTAGRDLDIDDAVSQALSSVDELGSPSSP